MNIDTGNTLTVIGMVASVIGTLVVCTWRLSSKISLGIQTTEDNTAALKSLKTTFEDHVTESNDRDRQNQREHAAIARNLDSLAAVDQNQGKRLDRTEKMAEEHHTRLAVIETRLSSRSTEA